MFTYVVPSIMIFGDFSIDPNLVLVSMPSSLRSHLTTRLFDDDTSHLERDMKQRFLTFDNLKGKGVHHCRITGWIGSSAPRKVVQLNRQYAIDVVRDLFGAYPLFSEGFNGSYLRLQGNEVGVFSSGH